VNDAAVSHEQPQLNPAFLRLSAILSSAPIGLDSASFALHTFTKSARRKDHRRVDLISDVLPFGHLWYGEPNAVRNGIGYAMHNSRSHHAVIRVYEIW